VASLRARVYALVRRIPPGRVATYGEIATLLGFPRRAREVGWALHACADERVPCHRVVDRHGRTAPHFHSQRARLEDEGVTFVAGRVDLERYGWP
jgi:methylated-DNA-protein-cysteine methyltransferase-like protein